MCDEKDGLTSEVEQLRAGSQGGGAGVEQAGELTHLQAENTALQKSLQGMYQIYCKRQVQNLYYMLLYIPYLAALQERLREESSAK